MTPMKIKDRSDPIPNAGVITGTPRQIANLTEGFTAPHQSGASSDTMGTLTLHDPSSVPLEKSEGPVVARPNDKPSSITGTAAHLGKSSPQPAGSGVTFYANNSRKGSV